MGGFVSPFTGQQAAQALAATAKPQRSNDMVFGLIGQGIGAAANVWEGKKAREQQNKMYQQHRADIAAAKGELDQWLAGIAPQAEAIYAGAMGPQVTTTDQEGYRTSTGEQYTAPEVTRRFAPTLNMLQNRYKGRVSEAAWRPAGILEGEMIRIGGEEAAGERELENIARARGIDPSVLKIGSPVARQAAQARAGARRGAEEMRYGRETAALGDLGNLAQIWGRAQRAKTQQRERFGSKGTTTGPGNYGAAAGALGLTKPDVFV